MVRWFDDFAGDLESGGFDAADVRIACANWRTSEARKMPSPGELLAYCRKVFRPDRVIEPPPPRPPMDPQERARIGELMRGLAKSLSGNHMDLAKLARRPGETQVDQARRLWPKAEVRRA